MSYSQKINSVTITKPMSLKWSKSLDKWAGNFSYSFRDRPGTFNILNGHDISVYDDAVKKLGGIIKKFQRDGRIIKVTGLDYTDYLVKVYVNEVYHNQTVDYIVKDLIAKYAPDLTTNNVYTSTKTIAELRLKNVQLFKALQDLAKYDKCSFYVDKDKDMHFAVLGSTDSGIDLVLGTNILADDYDTVDEKLINKVKISGGREEYIKTTTITAIAGQTEFSLSYIPVSVRVTVNGVEKIGFKEGMKTTADYDYSIDKENKKVVFHTAPGAGKSVVIEYTYGTPVLISSQDDTSIDEHGTYERVIEDETINKKSEAQNIAAFLLAKYSEPFLIGSVTTRLNLTAELGQTVDVANPVKNINNTFVIVGMEHNFYSGGRTTTYQLASLQESVLEILAELVQRVEAMEEKQRGSTDLISYLRSFVDSAKSNDDPANNLAVKRRTVNLASTWYFAKPNAFSEPIVFGGGSGPYGDNLVVNPSE